MNNEALAHSLGHIVAVKELLEELMQHPVELYEHSYQAGAFGSWTIVAGQRKRQFKFEWDGKDNYLTVSTRTTADSQTRGPWCELQKESGRGTSFESLRRAAEVLKHAV